MLLVKDGKIVDDPYLRVLDESPIADEGAVLVPAARLLADAGKLLDRSGEIGVLWPNDRPISALAPLLDRLALVALIFPSFRDGRAYSQARLLRERHRFRGELRATGQVLRDQLLFLDRAGFDAFEVANAADANAFLATMHRYSVVYQPASDGRVHAFRRRIAAAQTHARSPAATTS
jgi:uncharacterized protein (DUF934 family)